jgi:hypothetical protein
VLALSLDLFVQVPVLDEAGAQIVKEGEPLTMGLAKYYVGDSFVNIGTFLATALAMVVGSLLKPSVPPQSPDSLAYGAGAVGGKP